MENKKTPLLFTILDNLYVNKHCDWIEDLDDEILSSERVEPFIIQRWLLMNDNMAMQVRWLDKYVYNLNVKMYLSLAWSIIPKVQRPPRIPYISKKTEEEEYLFILDRIRKHLELSDNDYNSNKQRLINYIKKDMSDWFCYYGIPKKYWEQYNISFEKIKEFNCRIPNKQPTNNLSKWGL